MSLFVCVDVIYERNIVSILFISDALAKMKSGEWVLYKDDGSLVDDIDDLVSVSRSSNISDGKASAKSPFRIRVRGFTDTISGTKNMSISDVLAEVNSGKLVLVKADGRPVDDIDDLVNESRSSNTILGMACPT